MLRELRVRHFAVVENATVAFGPGLNVLTGETGTGKSVLIDAIVLVRGGRAQAETIRTDADEATVEAVFEVEPGSAPAVLLDEAGLRGDDGMVVVRRELTRGGRHRAFVNDSPVTVGLLERLGDCLVEIHGQHEHQRLLEPARQLELLDRFGGLEEDRQRVVELHARHRTARDAVDGLRSAERDRVQREDALRFQVAELAAARLRPGEEEELRSERRRRQHAERIRASLAEVGATLRDDAGAALARIARAARVLGDLGRLDPALGGPVAALDAAAAHLDEALVEVRRLAETVDVEPDRLQVVEERLDALTRLRRKYGDSEEAMIEYHAAAARELERLERHDEVLAAEERRLAELTAELRDAAGALGAARSRVAERLGDLVQREIRGLGMERAAFVVRVDRRADGEVGPRGLDAVEFLLSANPGEDLRPLARIASGGELARTMLGLHVVLAGVHPVPTMVFDEVDAGIGGRVAGAVADRLAALGRARQVLCVTHLPQIAARASHHLSVDKAVRGGRTRATVAVVAGARRVDEIARMLGGERVTDAARRHARELLEVSRGRRAGGDRQV
jgi:DNA repair protein RecN (Recombination protein N)